MTHDPDSPISDEIEMLQVDRNKWMTREEAARKGYNLWHLECEPEKDAPFWGTEGLWPLLTIALVIWFTQLVGPIVHGGVDSLFTAIGLQ